jgi:hypothetical protein
MKVSIAWFSAIANRMNREIKPMNRHNHVCLGGKKKKPGDAWLFL